MKSLFAERSKAIRAVLMVLLGILVMLALPTTARAPERALSHAR